METDIEMMKETVGMIMGAMANLSNLTEQPSIEQHFPSGCTDTCDMDINDELTRGIENSVSQDDINCSSYPSEQTSSIMVEHGTTKGEMGFGCGICEYRTELLNDLRQHLEAHTGQMPYECHVCKKYRTRQLNKLQNHIQKSCSPRHYCDKCDFQTRHPKDLKSHKEGKHNGEKPFACSFCDYRVEWEVSLEKHIMLIHKDEKSYTCNYCEHRATNYSDLRKHKDKKHGDQLQYACDECDRRYEKNWELTHHIKIVHQEKMDACDRCDFRSSDANSMRTHKTLHDADAPYACGKCVYHTADPTQLKTHVKTHVFFEGIPRIGYT